MGCINASEIKIIRSALAQILLVSPLGLAYSTLRKTSYQTSQALSFVLTSVLVIIIPQNTYYTHNKAAACLVI